MAAKPFPLEFQSGIQRDGTPFDSQRYLDGLWCRWRLGRPRSMGGYIQITDTIIGMPRRLHLFYQNGLVYAHVATVAGIQQIVFDVNGNYVSSANRTPVAFTGGADASFTMDAIYDTTSQTVLLVVHCVPDGILLSASQQTTPFIGPITTIGPLSTLSNPAWPDGVYTTPSISGGVVCIQPYLFDFDNYGLVQWSSPNLPNTLGITGGTSGAGQARISAQKIVAGYPLRGGGVQSPAALFWSLSEVITATFVGSPAVFAFNTISPSSSILSNASVLEYDGLYFWVGVDRFLVFNGTVAEVPNNQNQDWFFDNLTPGYEGLTYAFKVPRYGEIWWCACMFGSTVPNHAVIFNLRENCWYDTELPNNGRSAGYFAQGVKFPIMTGVSNDGTGFSLWRHESGKDQMIAGVPTPIRSYYETGFFGGPRNNPPADEGLAVAQLEPDFIQTNNMEVTMIGAPNARATPTNGETVPLLQIPTVPQEQFVGFTVKQSQRLSKLHVESNTLGGSFISGRNLLRGDLAEKKLL